jgi:hypothetical protein
VFILKYLNTKPYRISITRPYIAYLSFVIVILKIVVIILSIF